MISLRLEGDPGETAALIAVMRAAGIEVQVGVTKPRREGFTHTYAVARLIGPLAAGRPSEPDLRKPIF